MVEYEPVRPYPVKQYSPIEKVIKPFHEYMDSNATSGIILIISVVVALTWANMDPSSYSEFWHTNVTLLEFNKFRLEMSLTHWINEFLMAIFFLVVGLEVKRELVIGHLREPRKAILPLFSAVGGAIVPISIYFIINYNNPSGYQGWGVPAATDIAFALGVLYLLGNKIPDSARLFLAVLAIVDDIIAISIITIFYSSTLNFEYILLSTVIFAILVMFNRLHVSSSWPYLFIGIFLWYSILQSGIHATISGVLLAMTIPSAIQMDYVEFKNKIAKLSNQLDDVIHDQTVAAEQLTVYIDTVATIERASEKVQSPLANMKKQVSNFSIFIIVPLFALANAGIVLNAEMMTNITNPIPVGIVLGLFIGKPLGIVSAVIIAIKLDIGDRLEGLQLIHIVGIGFLAGIGFTMAIFIGTIAFTGGEMLDNVKFSILIASLLSGFIGLAILMKAPANPTDKEAEDI